MKSYERRWFYALCLFGIFGALGYFYDLKARYVAWNHLASVEKKLTAKLVRLKPRVEHAPAVLFAHHVVEHFDEQDLLSQVLLAAQQQSLIVQTVEPLPKLF